MAWLSENAQKVLTHLQANAGADMTAKDIAAACDIPEKSINGVITAMADGKRGKGLVTREEVATDDGTVKYVRLTSMGASWDPAAEKPED